MIDSIAKLADHLPGVNQADRPVLGFDAESAGLTYANPGSHDYFVSPELHTEVSDENPAVVLVSAPGAVGKSTFAEAMAHTLGAPLWNLSKTNVGSGSLLGTLLDILGVPALTPILDAWSKGKFFLVLDALDETLVASGSKNFESFLRSICELPKKHLSVGKKLMKPVIALHARPETADVISYALMDCEVPHLRLEIRHFDLARTRDFIDKRLDRIAREKKKCAPESAPHRSHRASFEDARDRLLSLVYRVLDVSDDPWSSPDVRSFLGYAPVLEVLTNYLDVNPASLVGELQALEQKARIGRYAARSLLTDIAERVLVRERIHIVDSLQARLKTSAAATGWSSWNDLYLPDEQRVRLTHLVLQNDSSPPDQKLLNAMPATLRHEYEAVVRERLEEHPFLRTKSEFAGSVFRELMYAWALCSEEASLSTAIVERYVRGQYLPTHLLSWFYLLHRQGVAKVRSPAATEFSVIYDSLVSQLDQPTDLSIIVTGEGSDAMAEVSWKRISQHDGALLENIPVVADASGLHFPRRLKSTAIDFDGPVTLGHGGHEFLLGPGVTVRCATLAVESEEVVVHGISNVALEDSARKALREGETILVAEEYAQGSILPRLTFRHGGRMRVQWPKAAFPWREHVRETPEADPRMKEAHDNLWAIMREFRGGTYEGLGRARQRVDQALEYAPEMRKALFEHLHDGIKLITDDGRLYKLDEVLMARHQLSRTAMMSGEITPGARGLLTGFLSTFN